MGKRTVDRRANSPPSEVLFRDGQVNHGKSIRESLAGLDGKKVKRGRNRGEPMGFLWLIGDEGERARERQNLRSEERRGGKERDVSREET